MNKLLWAIWFPFGLLIGLLAVPGLLIGIGSRWLIQHSPLAYDLALCEWICRWYRPRD